VEPISRIPAARRGLDPVPAAPALERVTRDPEDREERRRRRPAPPPQEDERAPEGPVHRGADGRLRVDVQA
jgi:hypothetical protein